MENNNDVNGSVSRKSKKRKTALFDENENEDEENYQFDLKEQFEGRYTVIPLNAGIRSIKVEEYWLNDMAVNFVVNLYNFSISSIILFLEQIILVAAEIDLNKRAVN